MRRHFLLAAAGLVSLCVHLPAQSPSETTPQATDKTQGVEVAVEIHMLSIPAAAEEKFLASMNLNTKDNVAFLDNAQRQSLLLSAVASDKRVELMQAPKLTVTSGQRGSVQLIDHQFFLTGVQISTANGQMFFSPDNKPYELGFRSTICPTVSADRQFVNLDLHVKRTTLASTEVPLIPVQIPVSQILEATQLGQPTFFQMFLQAPQFATIELKQQFNIPTGKTALTIAGKEMRPTRTETAPPIFSKIPYLSRLFRNTACGQETCTTIVLVTPQIVTNGEPREASVRNTAPSGN